MTQRVAPNTATVLAIAQVRGAGDNVGACPVNTPYGRPVSYIFCFIDMINIYSLIVKGTHKGCPYTHDYVFFWVVAGAGSRCVILNEHIITLLLKATNGCAIITSSQQFF